MKYMLLIYSGENAINEGERQACYVESTQLCHDLNSRGQFISASPLQPVATATSVKMREGKKLVTDGPFAETREQLGGYFMVEAQDLDEAIFQGFSLVIYAKDESHAKTVFENLSNGGQVRMPLSKTFFSPAYGMLSDKFGVPWMVTVQTQAASAS